MSFTLPPEPEGILEMYSYSDEYSVKATSPSSCSKRAIGKVCVSAAAMPNALQQPTSNKTRGQCSATRRSVQQSQCVATDSSKPKTQ